MLDSTVTTTLPHTLITGSYNPEDVTFLLKKVDLTPTGVDEKEDLIQSGQAHYSEMISEERRPDERYMNIFQEAWKRDAQRMASDILSLAGLIRNLISDGSLNSKVTLCSLVRAGVPYGVLLHRELLAMGVDSQHFGVSIIRDRGLDENAMSYIRFQRPDDGIIFVDGWTGKGAISRELQKSWKDISGKDPLLAVLADPAGYATMSGSHDDWLIPSGIMGANVSGLISRTILNSDIIGPDDFHGSIPVRHLADIDVSRSFVNHITRIAKTLRGTVPAATIDEDRCADLRKTSSACVNRIAQAYEVSNLNRIKPGIAEATRAVLRRKPRKVFIRSRDDRDLSALIHLCETDGVDLEVSAEMTGPYRAITLIEKVA